MPAWAARPLIDSGKWDNYFAIFARDAAVPWKPITLRLDTYSGAAVEFAAYDVDPADVLVAGANSRPRALDTSHLTPVTKWRFTPPAGLRFASNDVAVPLKDREGFFVIEARRGDAVQQVWLNLSRVGLIVKETAAGALVYGADLGNGRALAGMRITYLVGRQFTYEKTDALGISHVPAKARFALAEWGHSKAFVSFLPQSPPPSAVVAVRADRASVRAGESVRIVGFARRRSGEEYRPASGQIDVTLVRGATTLTSAHLELDKSGAFSGELAVPAQTASGDVAILATAGGASGGAAIHVDAAGDVALAIATPCTTTCPPAAPIVIAVNVKRANAAASGETVRLRIVRVPHVLAPGTAPDAAAWGTMTVADQAVRTDRTGVAHVTIPAPSDGLASTYGIEASDGSATASAQLIAPTAKVALAIVPEHTSLDVDEPVTLAIHGFDPIDGSPVANLSVGVHLAHGPSVQDQTVTLDAFGNASVTFRDIALGMNLVSADADVGGAHVLDMAAVTVSPSAISGRTHSASADVRITLDHARQKPGERVTVSASLAGAVGDALVTIESARGVATAVVAARDGNVSTALVVPVTVGAVSVGVAFVRDGAMVDATRQLIVDGPGHTRTLALRSDQVTYAPGGTAKFTIDDGDDRAAATLAVRVSDRRAAGGAAFEDVGGVLGSNGATTQNVAAEDPSWHTWVAPAKSTVGDIFGTSPAHSATPPETPIAPENERVLVWKVDRLDGPTFTVDLPRERGHYVLSVVKVTDDGDVGTASLPVTVQ